jgi:hypothetical protein
MSFSCLITLSSARELNGRTRQSLYLGLLLREVMNDSHLQVLSCTDSAPSSRGSKPQRRTAEMI